MTKDEAEKRHKQNAKNLTALQDRASCLEERTTVLETYEKRMTDLRSNLTSLEKRLNSHLGDPNPESGDVAYSKIYAKKRQIDDQKIVKLTDSERLDAIESTVASTDVVNSLVRGLEDQIGELEADLKARIESLQGLTQEMIDNDSRDQESKTVSELFKKCDILTQSLEALKNDNSWKVETTKLRALIDEKHQMEAISVDAKINATNLRLDTLAKQSTESTNSPVEELTRRVNTSAEFLANQKQMTELQEEARKTQEKLTNMEKSAEELRSRIDGVERKLTMSTDQPQPRSTSEEACRTDASQVSKDDMIAPKEGHNNEIAAMREELYNIKLQRDLLIKDQTSSRADLIHCQTQLQQARESLLEAQHELSKPIPDASQQQRETRSSVEHHGAANEQEKAPPTEGAHLEGAQLEETHRAEGAYEETNLSSIMNNLNKGMQDIRKSLKNVERQQSGMRSGAPVHEERCGSGDDRINHETKGFNASNPSNGERDGSRPGDDCGGQKEILKKIEKMKNVEDVASTLTEQLRALHSSLTILLDAYGTTRAKSLEFGVMAYAIREKLESESLKEEFMGIAEEGVMNIKYGMSVQICILMAIDKLRDRHTLLGDQMGGSTNIYRMTQHLNETLDDFMTRLLQENRRFKSNDQLAGEPFFKHLVASIKDLSFQFDVSKLGSRIKRRLDCTAQQVVDLVRKEVFTQGTPTRAAAEGSGNLQKRVTMDVQPPLSTNTEQPRSRYTAAEFRRTETSVDKEHEKFSSRGFDDWCDFEDEDEEEPSGHINLMQSSTGDDQRYFEWFAEIAVTMKRYGGDSYEHLTREDVRNRYREGLCLGCGADNHSLRMCKQYTTARRARGDNDEVFKNRIEQDDYRGRSRSPGPRGGSRAPGRFSPGLKATSSRPSRDTGRRQGQVPEGRVKSRQPGYFRGQGAGTI